MLQELTSNPLFGLILSVAMYLLAYRVFRKYPYAFLNPLIVSTILVIAYLKVFDISYDDYFIGGRILDMMVAPATVALGIPLYHTFHLLKKHYKSILTGIFLGTIACTFLIGVLGVLFNFNEDLIITLLPKSVTSAIAVEISIAMGGIPSLTIAMVIVSGILGAVVGPSVLKKCNITDELAQGIALGTAAHAVGTSKAIEMGKVQGAMSGLAIGITGVFTVFIAPLVLDGIRFLFG